MLDKDMGITKIEYSNLDQAFEYLNRELFEGALPDVLFTYQYRGKYYGFYYPTRFVRRGGRTGRKEKRIAEIALNPKVFAECDDMEIVQTIGHEMCHHWQHIFGKPSRSNYHNKQFAFKMQAIGLMPSSTGKPGGKKTGPSMADYVIPNGRFERAAIRLLKLGYTVNFEAPRTIRDYRTITLPNTQQGTPTATVDVPGLEQSPEHVHQLEQVPDSHPNAKTTFKCLCGDNMWGKPSLQARCKKCGGDFVPA